MMLAGVAVHDSVLGRAATSSGLRALLGRVERVEPVASAGRAYPWCASTEPPPFPGAFC